MSDPNATLPPGFSPDLFDPSDTVDVVLNLLQSGVSPQLITRELRLKTADLTGDRVPEIVVDGMFDLAFIGCTNGSYEILSDYQTAYEGGVDSPSIVYVGDMNRDGTPEVVLTYNATTGGLVVADVLEWDGTTFQRLAQANHGYDSIHTSRLAQALYWYETNMLAPDEETQSYWGLLAPYGNGPGHITILDTDSNGTKELVLSDHGPVHLDTLYSWGPWRGMTATLTWDGLHFLYSKLELSPATYRFQAVQDADRQFLLGNYDEALRLYQDVVFSDKLRGWSPAHAEYLQGLIQYAYSRVPTPTPPPDDPNEWTLLAAYARYRIMLLHIVRGDIKSAGVVHSSLDDKFPEGNAGHVFAAMADAYWDHFSETGDLRGSCEAAIFLAKQSPEALAVLGSIDQGQQSHRYVAADVCPLP